MVNPARAGLAALIFPALMLAGVVVVLPDRSGDLAEVAKAAFAALLLLIAAPPTWLLLPWGLPLAVVVGAGIATGIALWYWYGRWLGAVAGSWKRWRLFYAGTALGWSGLCMFGFVVAARLA